MKFIFCGINILIYVFLSSLENFKCLRNKIKGNGPDQDNQPDSSSENNELNNYINKGFNILKDASDLVVQPSFVLGDNNIFSYTIDVAKIIKDANYKVDGLRFNSKSETKKEFKYISDYNYTELKEVTDMVVSCPDLPVLSNNFFIRRGKTIDQLYNKTTLVYSNELSKLTIELDMENSKFPKLNDKFITDTLNIFGVELKTFENQDKYLTDAYNYIKAYGTHIIKKIVFGARMIFIGEILKEESKNKKEVPPKQVETVIKAGKFEYEDKIKQTNRVDDSNDIIIKNGNCDFDSDTNEMKDCKDNYSHLAVIRMEVVPLYELFKPGNSNKLKKSSGDPFPAASLTNVYNNLKNLISGLTVAMDVRNSPISDLYVINNLKNEDIKFNPCLKKKRQMWKYREGSVWGMHFRRELDSPIFGFAADSLNVKHSDRQLVNNAGTSGNTELMGSYACCKKSVEVNPDFIFRHNKFNNKYINNIYFKTMDKMNKGEEKNCNVLWTTAPAVASNSEDIINSYLCLGSTCNPFDPKIITDIKLRNFNGDKCENEFKFNERKYTCICSFNLLKAANSVASNGKYLCYSNKISDTVQ